jgi:hypothetical protein
MTKNIIFLKNEVCTIQQSFLRSPTACTSLCFIYPFDDQVQVSFIFFLLMTGRSKYVGRMCLYTARQNIICSFPITLAHVR